MSVRQVAGQLSEYPPCVMNSTTRLKLKVVPGARQAGVVGWMGDALKVKVTAPPEGGRANEEVCKMLAELCGLPQRDVVIAQGATQRQKVVQFNAAEARVLSCLPGR